MGIRWEKDETGDIERLAKRTVQALGAEAAAIDDDDLRKAALKWALTSESRHALEAMIKHAMSEPGIPITPRELNADPWLLNVSNGTINLKDGSLQPHRREDYCTKLAPVEFHREAQCPRWDQAEAEIFAADAELARYMRRVIGYTLTGADTQQELYILHGDGSNGKNLYLDTVRDILGDYAIVADSSLLLATKTDRIPIGEAKLAGMRFAMA